MASWFNYHGTWEHTCPSVESRYATPDLRLHHSNFLATGSQRLLNPDASFPVPISPVLCFPDGTQLGRGGFHCARILLPP